MKRLLIRLAPAVLMGYPVWVYSDHFDGLDRSLEWRAHTYEARSVAERLARHAGCPPDVARLPGDVDDLARITGDNPAQVARVAEIRRALDPLDAARVSRLAEAAIQAETDLLPSRSAVARDNMAETKRVAMIVFGVGFLVAVVQAFVDFLYRATAPNVHHVPAARRDPAGPPVAPSHTPPGPRPGGGR